VKVCSNEKLLALYVEGDLADSQAARMSDHLLECAGCREIVDELTESQSAFKALRSEVAPDSAHAIVRDRVMQQAVLRKSTGWMLRLERLFFGARWKYAVCGLALAALVSGTVVWQFYPLPAPPQPPQPVLPVANNAPEPAPRIETNKAAPARPSPPRPPKRTVAPKPDPEPALAQMDEAPRQMMVKMLTNDPNIVIYWLLDEKGGSE
jgi:hypothetical protein